MAQATSCARLALVTPEACGAKARGARRVKATNQAPTLERHPPRPACLCLLAGERTRDTSTSARECLLASPQEATHTSVPSPGPYLPFLSCCWSIYTACLCRYFGHLAWFASFGWEWEGHTPADKKGPDARPDDIRTPSICKCAVLVTLLAHILFLATASPPCEAHLVARVSS